MEVSHKFLKSINIQLKAIPKIMKRARRNKTVAQQCKYYEVENIYEYMVSVYIHDNIELFKILHKELCKDARKEFITYLFDEVIPAWRVEIIQATIY